MKLETARHIAGNIGQSENIEANAFIQICSQTGLPERIKPVPNESDIKSFILEEQNYQLAITSST